MPPSSIFSTIWPDEIAGLDEDVETLYDYADELDEDLGEVEREIYGDFDEDDYDDYEDGDEELCDGSCCGDLPEEE